MHYCFISDLHLCAESDSDALFDKFLQEYSDKVSELYILGDLFEYWIGDDAMGNYHLSIANKIKSAQDKINNIYFMAGNRDFLVKDKFLELSGMKKLKDPYTVKINKVPFLLSHGDALCTFDKNYQAFRKLSRNSIVEKLFLSLPISFRKKVATELRKENKQTKNDYSSKIYDVNDDTVKSYLKEAACKTIIHGHTHKPGVHSYKENLARIVLGDWHSTAKVLFIDLEGKTDLKTIS